jgi:S1-C subfamily serine protease
MSLVENERAVQFSISAFAESKEQDMTNFRCGRRTAARGVLLVAVTAMVASVAQAQTNSSTQNNPTGTATGQVQDNSQAAQQAGQQTGQQTTQQAGQQSGQQTANQDAIGAKFEHAGQGQGKQGLRVESVSPNGPAAQAGLQAEDHVVSADGRPFRKARHLEAYLSAQVGRPVPLVVERNGRQMTIELMPQPTRGDHGWLGVLLQEARPNANNPANNANPSNGQHNQNAQPGQAQPNANGSNQNAADAQNAEPGKGAEIADLAPEGPAARAGLQRGDIITQVNGKEIDDAAELVADIHEMKPQAKAEFSILRNNQEQKVNVTLGNRAEEMAEGGQMGPGQGQYGQGKYPPPGQFGGGFPGQYPPQQYPGPNGQFAGQMGNSPQMHQQMMEQNQRIEQELKELRDEVRQLREQMQKK